MKFILALALASTALAQPPFLSKLSGGPPSFIRDGLMKFMERINSACEGSMLESCRCLTDKEHTGPFESIKEVQECKPTVCQCSDGTEVAPALPKFLQKGNNLGLAISVKDKFDAHIARILEICQGSFPESCPCTEEGQEPIRPPFVSPGAIQSCNPKECLCENGDTVQLPRTAFRQRFVDHLATLKALCEGEPPSSCLCQSSNATDFESLLGSPKQFLECLPDSCTCPKGELVQVPALDPPPFAKLMLERLIEQITTVCPGNTKPQSCQCSGINKADLTDFTNIKNILRCRPSSCTCGNGTSVVIEEPQPPKFIQALAQDYTNHLNAICEGDAPQKCNCSFTDLEDVEPPFEAGIPLFMCQVDACICANGESIQPKILQLPNFKSLSTVLSQLQPTSILGGLVTSICPLLPEDAKVECTCKDGSTLETPFSPPKMIQCQPQECKCTADEGSEQVVSLPDLPFGALMSLPQVCDGAAPISCQCSTDDKVIQPPFDNLVDIALTCVPEVCLCSDQSTPKVEIPEFMKILVAKIQRGNDPSEALKEFQGLCNGEIPAKLECQDGSLIEMTLALPFIMFQCRPKMYQCTQDSEKLPLQVFGCENGGLPGCQGGQFKLKCSNDEPVTLLQMIKAQTAQECVCKDGKGPICLASEQSPTCPDGEAAQTALGNPPSFLKNCQSGR